MNDELASAAEVWGLNLVDLSTTTPSEETDRVTDSQLVRWGVGRGRRVGLGPNAELVDFAADVGAEPR